MYRGSIADLFTAYQSAHATTNARTVAFNGGLASYSMLSNTVSPSGFDNSTHVHVTLLNLYHMYITISVQRLYVTRQRSLPDLYFATKFTEKTLTHDLDLKVTHVGHDGTAKIFRPISDISTYMQSVIFFYLYIQEI